MSLGVLTRCLYELTGKESFFEKSDQAFRQAGAEDEKNAFAWGSLYFYSGLILNQKERFEAGCSILDKQKWSDEFEASDLFISLKVCP